MLGETPQTEEEMFAQAGCIAHIIIACSQPIHLLTNLIEVSAPLASDRAIRALAELAGPISEVFAVPLAPTTLASGIMLVNRLRNEPERTSTLLYGAQFATGLAQLGWEFLDKGNYIQILDNIQFNPEIINSISQHLPRLLS